MRAVILGVAVWTFVGLPGAHAIVHAIEAIRGASQEHHHHDGDDDDDDDDDGPGHGQGAQEHLGVALMPAHAAPVVPPPSLAPALAPPAAPAGIIPLPTPRPGGIRGPPLAG